MLVLQKIPAHLSLSILSLVPSIWKKSLEDHDLTATSSMRIQSPTRFPSVCVPTQGSSLGRGGQMLLAPLSEMFLDVLALPGWHFPSFSVHTNVHIRHLVMRQSSIHEVLERGGRSKCSQVMLMLLVLDQFHQFSCSVVSDSVTPWTAAHQASLSITNSWGLPKFMSIELVMPSDHLILCHLLLLLPAIFPSMRVFSKASVLHIRWPKYCSFSFNISPSTEHSGLISFRMDWLDLLAVQGTLKSLLQHHSSKTSILRRSAFFIVQLSHPHMTTGKTIALTRRTFVGKVMSVF